MKYLKIIGMQLMTACVYFTAAQLIITAMFQLTAQEGAKAQFLPFDVEVILLGFSLVMALIQNVFRIKKLSFAVKLLIHFFLTMAAFFGLFISVRQNTDVNSILYPMLAIAAVYLVFAVIVVIVHISRKKKEEENKEYTPVFNDKDKEKDKKKK